ncbi:hypothetical protein chiPu_0033483, partial [Chiloscyllium punctatum]|nr:hypothetical protein [Chiloscyllium punctatum]
MYRSPRSDIQTMKQREGQGKKRALNEPDTFEVVPVEKS